MKSSYIMVKVPYTIQTEPILKEHSTTERKNMVKISHPTKHTKANGSIISLKGRGKLPLKIKNTLKDSLKKAYTKALENI